MTAEQYRTKSWLNRNFGAVQEIGAVQEKLEQLETEINRAVKPLGASEIQTDHNNKAQEIKLAEYSDLKIELQKKLKKLWAEEAETLRIINQISEAKHRTILILRYINRLQWCQIWKEMHIAEQTAFKYHIEALDAAAPFIPKDWSEEDT